MINNLIISILDKLETSIIKQKRHFIERKDAAFLKKYKLQDEKIQKSSKKYNGYQGTSMNLCESFVNSNVLNKNDYIIDIGCGTGIFLCYLLSRGYRNVSGVEIDSKLYAAAKRNIHNVVVKDKIGSEPIIYNFDFFDFEDIETYNVFYVFNPFNSEETYINFLERIKNSLAKKPRKIKIVFLYMNVLSKKAIEKHGWLKKTKIIKDKSQFCNMCIKFTVYENK